MGSLSIGHWLIVLLIVLLVFGTKRVATMGADLGKAVKGFKDGVKDGEEPTATEPGASGSRSGKAGADAAA